MTHIPDEIESKFYPVNIEEIRKSLVLLGAKCKSPMRLMRRSVYDHHKNPQIPVAYIRIRDEGDKITFSAKDYADPERGHVHQRELVVNVDDFQKTVDLMKLIGLIQTNYQESKRETWELGGVEVCIDVWPGLLPYIEIEAPSVQQVNELYSKLPLQNSKRYEGGLLKVYMEVYGWEKTEAHKHVEFMTFEKVDFEKKY
ncbi:MAG: CYTH domain-containing protein [Patescibacteria group bacterium]